MNSDGINNKYNLFESIAFGYRCSQSDVTDMDNTFTVEFRIGLEKPHQNIGLMATLSENRAIKAFSSRLFSESKICPYSGGAVGYGKVNHEDYRITSPSSQFDYIKKKTENGLELTGNLGVILFRTLTLQVYLNLAFVRTFNDYHGQGVVYTLGVM